MKHILPITRPDGLLGISPRSLCNIESRSRINLCFTRGDICTGTNWAGTYRPENRSGCPAVIEEVMLDEPQYWKNIIVRVLTIHYWIFVTACRIVFVITGRIVGLKIASKRWWWICKAWTSHWAWLVSIFPNNLNAFSPELSAIPHQLIMDKIYDVLRAYRYGCAE